MLCVVFRPAFRAVKYSVVSIDETPDAHTNMHASATASALMSPIRQGDGMLLSADERVSESCNVCGMSLRESVSGEPGEPELGGPACNPCTHA